MNIKLIVAVAGLGFAASAGAQPFWASLSTEAYAADSKPGAVNVGFYAAYYCTAAEAAKMFYGASTVSAIESYLADNFSAGRTAMGSQGEALDQYRDYALGQYTFESDYAVAVADDTYLAVAFYNDGDGINAYRVFGTDNAQLANGYLEFDDVRSGTGDWRTVSTPEPTSAILLLVGLAGIALRRGRTNEKNGLHCPWGDMVRCGGLGC